MLNDAGSIVRINVFETGLAFAIKYEGQDRVAVACYGDGALLDWRLSPKGR